MKRSRISAGLLMFRKKDGRLEVLLAHPGGPYFQNKDGGIWTVPKGEVGEGEDLLARAKIEFEEELGVAPMAAELIELGWIKQKGVKSCMHGPSREIYRGTSNWYPIPSKWNGRPVPVRWNPFRKLTGLRFFQ
jgi:predicted NUDIX family NTP pyrophosphohydrolase